MQRRAAAIYFVFFLVVGAAAYGYIGVAESTQEPSFQLDGTDLESGENTTIDGTEYSVGEVGHESSGGGHGGGGEGALVATLEWTNDSARQTATLENDSTLTYQNTSYTVVVPNGSEGSSFTLVEQQNVTQILANDDAVENDVVTRDDTDYVVFRENDSIRPASEYLPAPETLEFSVGDSMQYEGADATVAEVTSSAVALEWTGPQENSVDLQDGANVTLANGQQYFAYFPDDHTVSLVPIDQYDSYAQTVSEREYFHERMNGLWGVVIISGSAAFLILTMAYMPHRG
jgi:hypothetical protein